MPPPDLSPMVGKKDADSATKSATPIKDAGLAEILNNIKDQRRRDAVALIGCFGLRPVELLHHKENGKYVYVSYRKRTARAANSPLATSRSDCWRRWARSAGQKGNAATTTSWWNGCGAQSSTRRHTCTPTAMVGRLKSAWPASSGGTAM